MIILSCGVFDLLHIGHINYLKKIKKDNDKTFEWYYFILSHN